MAKGVSVTLYNADDTPYASGTDIAVMWFDSDAPPDLGMIKGKSAIATTTSGGVLSLDLTDVTGLAVDDWGFLVCYKLDGTDHEDSPTFASRMQVASMTGTTQLGPLTDFVRNPDWPAQVAPVNGVEKITGLVAVFDHDSNFLSLQCSGAVTIDWGDGGGTENFATAVKADHQYTYSSIPGTIVGESSAVAVTFTDTGDTVNRTAHGYQNGQQLVFAAIVTTTGIVVDTTYYVVNKAADTFQVASTRGGSAIALTSDGSGTVFIPQYKVAVLTITPQASNNITSFDLNKKHSQSGLQTYLNPWLSLSVNSSYLTAMVIAAESTSRAKQSLTEFYLGENAITDFNGMFANCLALAHLPLLNTASGTNFNAMFSNCSVLKSIPYMDTSSGTNFNAMFNACFALTAIPLLDTSSGTNFGAMFSNCYTLQSVPLLDTSSGTDFNNMFNYATALTTVPLFDTSLATTFLSMFTGCTGLTTVPLFNTPLVATFQGIFNNCNALEFVPAFNTASCINFSAMFQNCKALTTIPMLNTAAGTAFNAMFNGCSALKSVPLLNTSGGTNFTTMFAGCYSLQTIPALNMANQSGVFSSTFSNCNSLSKVEAVGIKQTCTFLSAKMSATELNNLFTNLDTVTAKTITVTSNYGAATCNTSIATSKGWTVTA